MRFPTTGMPREEVLRRLDTFRSQDKDWRGGRVYGFNFEPEEEAADVARAAFMNYLGENALDPTSFPSVHKLETSIVAAMADLLRGDEQVVGNFTSGGTESILLAVKAARDRARALRPDVTQPELVAPQTVHGAVLKAAHYFGVKPILVPCSGETFLADPARLRAGITPNTILLLASAPSYAQGVVDPIPEIGALALEHDLPLHIDACMGGVQLSLLRRMGEYDGPDFDFSVPGVTSISADLHKYGYAPKGASTVLYRSKELRRYQIFASATTTSYALVNNAIQSSRSAGPMAAAWAVLNFLGEEGYARMIRSVMAATRELIDVVNATGELYVLGAPQMSLLAIAARTINIFELADELSDRGWYVQPQFSTDFAPASVHLTVTHSTAARTQNFVEDLRAALAAVQANPEPIEPRVVREQVSGVLQSAGPEGLSEMAGLGEGGLPERMALVNTILDSLPRDVVEQLLIDFFNDWYV